MSKFIEKLSRVLSWNLGNLKDKLCLLEKQNQQPVCTLLLTGKQKHEKLQQNIPNLWPTTGQGSCLSTFSHQVQKSPSSISCVH